MNKLNVLNALVIGGLLTLAGCVSTQGGSTATVDKIATMNFNLPQQIKWKQVKSQEKNGNVLAEGRQEKKKQNNTPVRVIYQRLASDKTASNFLSMAAQPLQKVCSDIKISPFKTSSSYANQANAEILCARLGKNNFGTVSYLSVFADGMANHMLISEVKMPASAKAGVLKFKNAKEKQQAQNSSALAKLMYQLNASARVCDSKKNCQ